jgi:hypothetical protein
MSPKRLAMARVLAPEAICLSGATAWRQNRMSQGPSDVDGPCFLAAFNDIEQLFRSKLQADQYVYFAEQERRYGDK